MATRVKVQRLKNSSASQRRRRVDNPSKAIGSYWPFATTIFDFIRRSMPPAAPGSLSADQIYAVTAYLLAANKIIGDSDEINAQTLPEMQNAEPRWLHLDRRQEVTARGGFPSFKIRPDWYRSRNGSQPNRACRQAGV